jgi:hypothetical protein
MRNQQRIFHDERDELCFRRLAAELHRVDSKWFSREEWFVTDLMAILRIFYEEKTIRETKHKGPGVQ